MGSRRFDTIAATILFVFILNLATTSESHAASKPSHNAMPFRLNGSGFINVAVVVNGNGPFNFVLDTGSNRSAISARLVAQLKLPVVATSAIVTSAPQRSARIVRLDSLSLGSVTRNGILATVLGNEALAGMDGAADGLIGQDLLGDISYTLDYERQQLIWDIDGRTPPSNSMVFQLRRDEGRWLVGLPQSKRGGDVVWFVPDSGATAFVIFDRGSPSPLRLSRLAIETEVTTVNGTNSVQTVVLREFRVGAVVFQNRPGILIERRNPDAPSGDGLLPLSAFASVTFDADDSYLVVRRRQ
jgi:predicted aspartyl protease